MPRRLDKDGVPEIENLDLADALPPLEPVRVDLEDENPAVGGNVENILQPEPGVDSENENSVEGEDVIQTEPVPRTVEGPNNLGEQKIEELEEQKEKPEPVKVKDPMGDLQKSSNYEVIFQQQAQQFKYDGKYPSMAFSNNQVVVVYHHNNFINDMFYCVGKLNPTDGKIVWGEEHCYDYGAYPRVAVNNSGLVVQVHESARKRKTWYHVGMIYGDKIDWGPSYEIGKGLHPAVALSDDDQVVIVEESGGRFFSPESFYFFGKVNKVDKTILFSRKRELLVHSGKEPSVTMKGKDIIVAFRDARNHGRLHTMLGKIDGLNVSWAEYEFFHFAEGNCPSVTLNSEGVVVVSCQTYVHRRLLFREGQLKERNSLCYVQWSEKEARYYDHGVCPSICLLEGNQLIEFHGTNALNGHSMWYTMGDVRK